MAAGLWSTAADIAVGQAPGQSAKKDEEGLPWQYGALFTGFWVCTFAAVAIVSKTANRSDKPVKKIVE